MPQIFGKIIVASFVVFASTSFANAGCGGGSGTHMAASAHALGGTQDVSQLLSGLQKRDGEISGQGSATISNFLQNVALTTSELGGDAPAADIEVDVTALSTVSVPARSGRQNQLTLTNDTGETVCVVVSGSGFNGEVCVPAFGRITIAELFSGVVTIRNKSAVATIIVRGKWL